MPETDSSPPRLRKTVQVIERNIIKTLIALMSILLVAATIELGYVLVKSIVQSGSDHLIIDLDNLMQVFGVFLLVVIGIELLDTIKVYFKKNVIHVEVVMLVAIIAIARKIIVMDFDIYGGTEIIGIAAIMLALAAGYYLIKKTGGTKFVPTEAEESEEITIEEKVNREDDRILERKKVIKRKNETNPAYDNNPFDAPQPLKDPRLSKKTYTGSRKPAPYKKDCP
ncbi:MAG: phosphate-starvation-inducible PsiE family protein [Bacteroidales bacterium]